MVHQRSASWRGPKKDDAFDPRADAASEAHYRQHLWPLGSTTPLTIEVSQLTPASPPPQPPAHTRSGTTPRAASTTTGAGRNEHVVEDGTRALSDSELMSVSEGGGAAVISHLLERRPCSFYAVFY